MYRRVLAALSFAVVLATAVPAAAILTAPTNLTATAVAGNAINLTWTDANRSDYRFVIERSPNGSTFAQIATAPATARSYRDAGLSAGVRYYYRIRVTRNGSNFSPYSNVASAVTSILDTIAPGVPSGVKASAVSCSQVNVSWNAVTDAGGSGLKGYNVFRGGVFVRQVLAPATSVADTGLGASTLYSYTVSAVDNAGNQSARSAASSATTPACGGTSTTTTRPSTTTTRPSTTTTTIPADTTPPTVPTGVSARAVSCSEIDLGWNGSSDVGSAGLKGYNVYRGGAFLRQVLAPATTSADTGLVGASVYAYAVSALDKVGNESARSALVSTNTPACSVGSPGLMGFVPGVGTANDAVVIGTKAYVASAEFGLAVVDVANPGAAKAVAGTTPPFYGTRVAVSGGLAVVAGSTGLMVVDLTASGGPHVVGTVGGTVKGVAVGTRYAYAVLLVPGNPARIELDVVDLGTPAAPVIVGRVTLPGGGDVALAGSVVYVAGGSAGLQVVDVGNPAAPALIGSVDTPGNATGVAVANGWGYVADGTAVETIDVSVPSRPVVRGTVATAAGDVAVAGTRLYAVDGLQLKVLDVTNPAAPALLGAANGYGAQRVAAAGTMAYLASANVNAQANQGGLYLLDASTPSAPRLVMNVYGGFGSWGTAVAGTVGVATGDALGLKVLDVTTPAAPRVVGTVAGIMKGVAMAGGYVYALQTVVGNPAHVDVVVVDVRVPGAPGIVGRVTVAGGMELALAGTTVYVAALGAGVQVVDVSTPTAPRVIGSYDTAGTAHGVAVANGLAYVADETAVEVLDVSVPSRPVRRGTLATTATAVAVVGTRVYTVDGLQLKVIDVTNPAAPVLLSATTGYGAQAIDAAGTMLFLATPAVTHLDTSGGVYVIDAANGSAPRLVKQVVVPGSTRSVRCDANMLFAGDTAGVLSTIDLGY